MQRMIANRRPGEIELGSYKGEASPLTQYAQFRDEVMGALQHAARTGTLDSTAAHNLLNGGASHALTKHVERVTRLRYGIFFSGERLARAVAAMVKDRVATGATIGDPACGAGNLLLSCLDHAALHGDLTSTLDEWGRRVRGIDLHQELVATTRQRIALLAAFRLHQHGLALRGAALDIDRCFPEVYSGDYLAHPAFTATADCVVMNPPFVEVDSPAGCRWSTGKVQQAALFTESVVAAAKNGQEIVAVLPDVLRSGTRYERWRSMIASTVDIVDITLFGRFDPQTNVDVFLLHARKKTKLAHPAKWPHLPLDEDPIPTRTTISDHFVVSVGAVVPHRHVKKGPWRLYVDVSTAPRHSEVTIDHKRRFTGTCHMGPFVVVRRTSSPTDRIRLVGTVVRNFDQVAVENHLLVLQPKDGTLERCRALMTSLTAPETNESLNIAIRCRHLTTRSVGALPLDSLP